MRAARRRARERRGDLLEFAVSLQGRIDDLYRAVDEVAAGLSRVDRRVDGAVTNTAVVRYDAYEGTGGQQSASVALLDATRTGTVVTAIQGRDYARIYVKDLDRGRSSVALSRRSRRQSSARCRDRGEASLALRGRCGGFEPGQVAPPDVGTCSVARRMKSTGVGGRGVVRRVMLVSSRRRSPLRWLQGAHEVTTFSQTEVPPLERGTTWSSVSRFPPSRSTRSASRRARRGHVSRSAA